MFPPNLVIEKNCLSERKLSEIMLEIEEHKDEFVPYESDFLKYDRWYPQLTNKLVSMIDLFLYSNELKKKASKYRDHCWRMFVSDSVSKFEVDVTKYYQSKNHKYEWHVDHLRIEGRPGRILNYVLYLNDNFKGGELQFSDHLLICNTKKPSFSSFLSLCKVAV